MYFRIAYIQFNRFFETGRNQKLNNKSPLRSRSSQWKDSWGKNPEGHDATIRKIQEKEKNVSDKRTLLFLSECDEGTKVVTLMRVSVLVQLYPKSL